MNSLFEGVGATCTSIMRFAFYKLDTVVKLCRLWISSGTYKLTVQIELALPDCHSDSRPTRYDRIRYVRSNADVSQIDQQNGTNN